MKKYTYILLLLASFILACYSFIELTEALDSRPTIVYNGSKKAFHYLNDVDGDMFYAFKNVVANDTLHQDILLKGESIQSNTQIYLEMLFEDENQQLIQSDDCKLSVSIDGKEYVTDDSGRTLLYQFTSSQTKTIHLTLTTSKELGNDYSDQQVKVQWRLTAIEDDVTTTSNVKTSDSLLNNLYLYIGLLLISIMTFIMSAYQYKKTK